MCGCECLCVCIPTSTGWQTSTHGWTGSSAADRISTTKAAPIIPASPLAMDFFSLPARVNRTLTVAARRVVATGRLRASLNMMETTISRTSIKGEERGQIQQNRKEQEETNRELSFPREEKDRKRGVQAFFSPAAIPGSRVTCGMLSHRIVPSASWILYVTEGNSG